MSSPRSILLLVSGIIAAGYAGQRLATSSLQVAVPASCPKAVITSRSPELPITHAPIELPPADAQPYDAYLPNPATVAFEQQCLQLAQTNPADAAQMAADASPPQDELLVRLIESWTQHDAASALTWIREREDQMQRISLLSRAGIALSEKDPLTAADFIAREINAGHECQQALTAIVGIWSRNNPRAVATWLSQFPEGPMLDVSVENLIDSWAFSDPQAARQWLAKLRFPTAREVGFAILAHHSPGQPTNTP